MSFDRDPQEGALTRRELRVLQRTRVAQDFGRRRIRAAELEPFAGPAFLDAEWEALRRRGYVAVRGMRVWLTAKGERALSRGPLSK